MKNCFVPYMFLLLSVNPIVTRHDKPEHAFLVDQVEFPEVVQLNLKDATGIVQMEGTFIRKNWILTAAHGLNSVEASQHISLSGKLVLIKQIIVHPGFNGFEHDIALIQLEQEIPSMAPVKLYSDADETGQEITIVGRGWSGTGNTGPVSNDQKLRRATNRIDSVTAHWIKFRFDEPGNPLITEYEGISGSGDSGGPAFISVNGNRLLAGVSSTQLNDQIGVREGHYGVMEYYTRVSSYISWIEEAISGTQGSVELPVTAKNNWGFAGTEIGVKASEFMDAIASKNISDQIMESVFYESFRNSFDLKGFVQGIANSLSNPRIVEIKRSRKNVLVFIVESEGKTYLIQLEADKRDDYKIGGLIFKKAD